MNSTNFPRFVFWLLITSGSLTLSAQSSKEAVILYNTEAVKAEITPTGDIIKIIKSEPDYLAGFKLVAYDYDQVFAQSARMPENEKHKGYDVVSADTKEIYFDSGFATLNKDAINKLDEIIKILNRERSKKLLIAEFEQNESDPLTKNRINSVKMYLRIKGISENKIQINKLLGVYPENVVRINVVN